jgi:regulatory protein
MKVTQLTSQKRDTSRANMYIDEEFFCGVSLNTLAKFNIYVGKEVEEKLLDEILVNELYNRFSDRAMSYISRSVKTEYQLRRYLKDLSFKKKDVWYSDIQKEKLEKIFNDVIKKLKEYGYVDDATFAEQFILSRIKNRPRGKSILISELISKGVSKDISVQKVNELVEDEFSVLVDTYRKKYKEEKITMQDRKKIDFLRRKGFNWELIEKYINNELEE